MSEKTDRASDGADSDLFRQAVGVVEPIRDDRILPSNGSALPLPRSTEADEQQVLHDMLSDYFEPAELDTGEELYYCRPGVQHAVLRKLRRGQFRVALNKMPTPHLAAATRY